MSVYVDILPDGCDSCVCNDDYWRCGINDKPISHNGRREDCPLKEIVRCKECRNRYTQKRCAGRHPDWFCADGVKQVTGKLKNPDNSLVTEESKDCKKQKSMSVLIKNMEMPKCCGECYLCHTQNFRTWCCPTGREDIYYDSIPEWCPLEEQKSKLNDDLVSRQAAIEAVEKAVFKGVAKSDIESLSSVEPKRLPQPHKCVVYRDGECRYPIEACSECPKHEGMRAVLAERPKTTETMMIDGEPTEIDPLSYEVGYTHGQFSERPKGAWVRHELWDMPWYTCSECNFHGRNDYNFCPNCGADMRGDKE